MKPTMLITGQDGETLEVKVISSCCEDWLTAEIYVIVPAFTAAYRADLCPSDFPMFYEAITKMKARASQEAEFSTLEDSLFIHIEQEKLGTLIVSGRTDTKLANVLHFRFKADNMQLDYIANQLQVLMKQYPVIGNP